MARSLKLRHMARYGDLARLLVKHGRVDGLRDERVATADDAERLAADLESRGATFVKFGQLLSTRSDLLPPVYLGALADCDTIVVPQPVSDYSTERVLTMDYVDGRNVASIGPLAQLDIDGDRLATGLFCAYLDQILVHGFVHADPHPGNVLLTRDQRLALIDLGMVTRIDSGTQEKLLRLLVAISDGNGHEAADVLLTLAEAPDEFDRETFV